MTHARLRELLLMWEEDDLSPPEAEELSRLLDGSPDARRELIDHFMVTNQAYLHFKAEAAESQTDGLDAASRQDGRGRPMARPRSHRRRRLPGMSGRPNRAWGSWGVASAAAAVLIVALGLLFTLPQQTRPARSGGPDLAASAPPPDVAIAAKAPVGRLTRAGAGVEVRDGMEGAWSSAGNGVAVHPADWLRTGDSRATVALDSGGLLCLDTRTTMSFGERLPRAETYVTSGTIYADTAGGRGLRVRTAHGSFEDIGTRFGVEVCPEYSQVMVLDGEVRASNDTGSVSVGPSSQVRVAGPSQPMGPAEVVPDLASRFAWALGGEPAPTETRTIDVGSTWNHDGELEAPVRTAYDGRDGVWRTHPSCDTAPFRWLGTLELAEGCAHFLEIDVNTHPSPPGDTEHACDWVLVVVADGEELLRKTIEGNGWQTVRVDLTRFAGREAALELWNTAGGRFAWFFEYGYWGQVRLSSQRRTEAGDDGNR